MFKVFECVSLDASANQSKRQLAPASFLLESSDYGLGDKIIPSSPQNYLWIYI